MLIYGAINNTTGQIRIVIMISNQVSNKARYGKGFLFFLSEDLLKDIKMASKEQQISISAFIRQATATKVREHLTVK